jgi:hypothetical protein
LETSLLKRCIIAWSSANLASAAAARLLAAARPCAAYRMFVNCALRSA